MKTYDIEQILETYNITPMKMFGNNFVGITAYLAYNTHKKCKIKEYDLFSYTHSCMGINEDLNRAIECDIYFNNILKKLNIPLICDRKPIIEIFMTSHNDKNLLLCDMNLNFFQMRNQENYNKLNSIDPNIIEYNVTLINNNNFGLVTFSENNQDSHDMDSRCVLYGYCM